MVDRKPGRARPPEPDDMPQAVRVPTVTGAAFWALMAKWQVPDPQALQLIDHPPSPSGKRPRFALTTDQARRLAVLREIDVHLPDVAGGAGWLHRSSRAPPFHGKSPLAYMAAGGMPALEGVLRHLGLAALKQSLAASPQGNRRRG